MWLIAHHYKMASPKVEDHHTVDDEANLFEQAATSKNPAWWSLGWKLEEQKVRMQVKSEVSLDPVHLHLLPVEDGFKKKSHIAGLYFWVWWSAQKYQWLGDC